MTLEVSESTEISVEFDTAPTSAPIPKGLAAIHDHIEFDTAPIPPSAPIPKGLAAIHDHIHPSAPPKPNCIERFLINIGLLFFHLSTWTIQFSNWILKTFFGMGSRQKVLYRELHLIAKNGDPGEIKEFLIDHSEEPHAAGFLFAEFLALPELYFHMPEILQGANVCLVNDHGFFCRRWSDHPDSYSRISSHAYQEQECYAIGHFLFWLDPEGNTRFQFEKSPLIGFFSSVNHIIDYLRYRRDNEQQGVMGSSPFIESHCLKVSIDPEEFMARKSDYFRKGTYVCLIASEILCFKTSI